METVSPIFLKDASESIEDQLKNFNENNWTDNISYFDPVRNFQNIMSIWIGGCEFVEKMEDQRVIEDLTVYLRKMMGRKDIPYPKNMIRFYLSDFNDFIIFLIFFVFRSKWNSEKYFKGSYTNLPVGSLRDDFEKLAKPIYVKKVKI